MNSQSQLVQSMLSVDYHDGKQYRFTDYSKLRQYVKIVMNMNV